MRPDGGTQTETLMRRPTFARPIAALLSLSALLVPAVGAQQASERPAARPLGAAIATSEAMRAISAVRQLPGGRLLVNDPASRRVVMLDSMMKIIKVVADTTSATQNAYGLRGGGILPWRGDSTLFLDPASLSMLVLDPDGEIKRVMAAPRPDDVFSLVGGALGYPGFDARGRLVYRATGLNFPRRGGGGGGGGGAGGGANLQPPSFPDTTPLVRFDLATRKLDTVAYIKVTAPRITFLENEGRRQLSLTVNPLPEVDDWAMLPDGTVAILRKDYHVDFIDADGKRTSSARIPFDWQRLTDSAKTAIIDSVKALVERGGPGAGLQGLLGGGDGGGMGAGAFGGGFGGFPGGGGGGGFGGGRGNRGGGGGGGDGPPPPRRDAATGGAAGGATPGGAAGGAGAGAAAGARPGGGGGGGGRGFGPQVNMVQPNELPDYRPAFANGSVRADADGKLWVRIIPTKPTGRGPEYDVIDRSGKLVDRVVLPAGTTIAGFGPGGTVYLGVRDAAGVHVVRARER